jgi:endogenous inhibitor of DNA gyrase (YacG/DUF329 family)
MAPKSDKDAETDRPDGVRVTAGKCVRCGQPVSPRYRPFCSDRCSDLDLAGWLTGRFRIPTDETPASGDHDAQTDED